MKESYVLKRRNGAVCGYIMARDGQLCARLPDEDGAAQIAAIYEDGIRTFEGKLDGAESAYPSGGKHLLGAYVCSEGKLLMDTGEAARAAFERAEKRQTPESTRKKTEEDGERISARREAGHAADEPAANGTTERRWPPPPCMPGAKYVNGAWQINPKAAR